MMGLDSEWECFASHMGVLVVAEQALPSSMTLQCPMGKSMFSMGKGWDEC